MNAAQILDVFQLLVDENKKLKKSQCRLDWSYGVDQLSHDPEEEIDDIDEEEVLSVDYVFQFSDSGIFQISLNMQFQSDDLDVEDLPADDGFWSEPGGFRHDVIESEVFPHISNLPPKKIQVWGGHV